MIASRTDDGFWSANARLPTAFQSGGSDKSRYKIRRDGSLSLALQLPDRGTSPKLDHNHHDPSPWPTKKGPTELRSFSVVLSDVDVVGRYDKPVKEEGNLRNSSSEEEDAYAKAGVSMYKLHSNSIHRMNASWKLNPTNSSPTSQELLQFLSLFTQQPSPSNQEERAYSSHSGLQDNKMANRNNYSLQQHSLPSPLNFSSAEGKEEEEQRQSTENKLTVKQPSQRKETRRDRMMMMMPGKYSKDNNSDAATVVSPNVLMRENEAISVGGWNRKEDNGVPGVVLHDLISTLGKLNNNNASRENGTAYLEEEDEDQDQQQEEQKRMKPMDPQQTAADLKRLMGLLFTSANKTDLVSNKGNDDNVSLVNVLIAPSNSTEPSNDDRGNSTAKSNQKIVFLQNSPVNHLLDTALKDPVVSSAANSIAAALVDNNLTPNDTEFSHLNDLDDGTLSVPNGFPLASASYLNLHHPNLQFHQALHHLLANGTAPMSINTTVKTNIINVFVLNFNGQQEEEGADIEKKRQQELLTSFHSHSTMPPQKNKEDQQAAHRHPPPEHEQEQLHLEAVTTGIKEEQLPSTTTAGLMPSNFKPILIEKAQESPLVFYDKIGVLSAPAPSSHKYKSPTLSSTTDKPSSSESPNDKITERVNLLELLPADLNAFKKVSHDDQAEEEPDLTSEAHKILTTLTREPQGNKKDGHLHGIHHHHHHAHESADSSRPVHVYVKTPSAVPHLWLLHQNKNEDKQDETSLPDYDDPEFPEDIISYGGTAPPAPDPAILDMYDDSPLSATMAPLTTDSSSTPSAVKKVPFYALRNNQTVTNPFLQNHPPSTMPHHSTKENSSNASNNNDHNKTNGSNYYNHTKNQISPSAASVIYKNATSTDPLAVPSTSSDDGSDTNLRNRVRKFITALGYSALPTIAAGAAATWSYWVPLVATAAGKKRRKRHNTQSNSKRLTTTATVGSQPTAFVPPNKLLQQVVNKAIEFTESEQSLPSSFHANAPAEESTMKKPKSIQTFTNSPSSSSSPTTFYDKSKASNLSPNLEGTEDEAKWIRVEVITESSLSSPLSSSSPTLPSHHLYLTKTHHHQPHLHHRNPLSTTYNNKPIMSSGTSDNVPHVSYSSTYANSQQQTTTKKDLPLLKNFFKNVISSEWNMTTTTTTRKPTNLSPVLKRPDYLLNSQDDPEKIKVMVKQDSSSDVNDDKESLKRKKLESLAKAQQSYASAVLLPLWFPILFGNRKATESKPPSFSPQA